jgi:hypothetical protein
MKVVLSWIFEHINVPANHQINATDIVRQLTQKVVEVEGPFHEIQIFFPV